jgi:regulatory protein YycH of two-component signal transduction system YycFG
MLAYGKAYYEWVEETEYIQPELIGTRVEAQELIYPNDIVLHQGNGEHVILQPKNVFYKEIFEKVSMRSFGGFREIDRRSLDWELLREQYRGVEIRFHEQVPASILDTIMQIEGGFPDMNETFDKIWITTNESGEEVRTSVLLENPLCR